MSKELETGMMIEQRLASIERTLEKFRKDLEGLKEMASEDVRERIARNIAIDGSVEKSH